MSVTPSGRVDRAPDGRLRLVITREFRSPIEDVWASVTEPERLARWIGTFTGDPASGRVAFRMTAEGDVPAEDMEIRACDPPRFLAVTAHTPQGSWELELALTERGGVTELTFSQPGIDPAEAESVGPGWEYYLDRLVAAETGGDVAAIAFEPDYYPAMSPHYRAVPE